MNQQKIKQKCSNEIDAFIKEALKGLCRSNDEAMRAFDEFNLHYSNGVAFNLSEEAQIASLNLGEAIVNTLGVKNASLKSVRDQSISCLATVLKDEDDWDGLDLSDISEKFLDSLVNTVLTTHSCVAPCELFYFADGETELVSEHVRVQPAKDVVASMRFPTRGKNWEIVAEEGSWPDEFKFENRKKLYGTVWDISCAAPKDLAVDAARWMAEVFVSAIRVGLQPADYCHRARIGERENEPFGKAIHVRRELVYGNEGCSFVSAGRFGTYKIDSAVKGRFDDEGFQGKLSQVLSPRSKSVGERLANSLGWAARARQASDVSVRLLYFFTSIEALFSEQHSFVPVADSIARYTGIVLSESPEYREATYQEVKKLYSLRSHLVHRGKRTVHWLNANNIQSICEGTQKIIWRSVDLSRQHSDLLSELKSASHGSKWPPVEVEK